MANIYRGFSTLGRSKVFRVNNQQLIKQDLINHFNIRKGEKLMNSNFGTEIWNFLYEPLTEEIKSAIIADINQVVSYDPRINVNNVVITEYEHGLMIEIFVQYVQTNQISALNLQFDAQTQTLTSS